MKSRVRAILVPVKFNNAMENHPGFANNGTGR